VDDHPDQDGRTKADSRQSTAVEKGVELTDPEAQASKRGQRGKTADLQPGRSDRARPFFVREGLDDKGQSRADKEPAGPGVSAIIDPRRIEVRLVQDGGQQR
jgi:hypothetical protein